MRRYATFLALAMCTTGARAAEPRYRLTIGDEVPDLALPRIGASERVKLHSLLGRPLAVSFYSRYCAPCQRELPIFRRVVERVNRALPAPRQVLPVVISLDSRAETQHGLHLGPSLTWLVDAEGLARAQFDPRTFPCTFLIDATGRVRHINRGFGPGYETRVERWLRGMVESPLTDGK